MAPQQRRLAMPEIVKRAAGCIVTFGDVVQLSSDRSKCPEADGFERYIGLEHLEASDLKVRRWGDLADGITFTNVFRPGQVLFGKRRAYQRKVAVAEFSGVCSGDIYVLEPKGEQLLTELLPFVCQSEPFYDYVISMSQGGLSPRVNWKALSEYEFFLPSMGEQRRIVEVLQSSSENINALFNLVRHTEELLDSLVIETLDIQRIENKETYEGRFELKAGSEIFTASSGNGEPTFNVDGDILYFKVADFNCNADHRYLSISEARFHSEENSSIRVFPPGTVVFPKRGASIFLNKIGILSHPAALDPNLMALVTDTDTMRPEFLMWFFKGLELWRFADTTSVPQLNHKHLKPVPVPLPSLAEQDFLIGQISKIADALTNSIQRLESSKQLANTLLNELMRSSV